VGDRQKTVLFLPMAAAGGGGPRTHVLQIYSEARTNPKPKMKLKLSRYELNVR
jgi:hypothetical protein